MAKIERELCNFKTTRKFAKLKGVPPEFSGTVVAETERAMAIQVPDGRRLWFPKRAILDMEKVEGKTIEIEETDRKIVFVSDEEGLRVRVYCPYSREIVSFIRTIPKRRWVDRKTDPDGIGYWELVLSYVALNEFVEMGFELDEKTRKWKERIEAGEQHAPEIKLRINGKLRKFQEIGVAEIEKRGGRALLADEMGLGKTVQAIAWASMRSDTFPAIVVVPASLKINWKREVQKWVPWCKAVVLSGKTPNRFLLIRDGFNIINYDVLQYWLKPLRALKPKTVILDEAHLVRNPKTVRNKSTRTLCHKIPYVICISGTPIENYPAELFAAIRLVDSSLFPSYRYYAERYCGRKWNGFGWEDKGATNTKELHDILTRTIMIRRRKKDVLSELPEKTKVVVPIDIDNRTAYQEAHKDLVSFLMQIDPKKARAVERAEALAKINYLRQLSVRGKLQNCIEWIKSAISQGEKLVVFAWHRNVLADIETHFKGACVKLTGGMGAKKKQLAVDLFQNDPSIRLFLGQIKAAGVGITLTASSNVVFLEVPWTPGALDQAEDRVHRIGQKADKITAWYLVATDTVEEYMLEIIDRKRNMISQVLDGEEAERGALLSELISKLRGDPLLTDVARSLKPGDSDVQTPEETKLQA